MKKKTMFIVAAILVGLYFWKKSKADAAGQLPPAYMATPIEKPAGRTYPANTSANRV